jgi:hypothetical protein
MTAKPADGTAALNKAVAVLDAVNRDALEAAPRSGRLLGLAGAARRSSHEAWSVAHDA